MSKLNSIVGMATVGAEGQIVIPAEARRELNLEEGSKSVVLRGRTKKTLVPLSHPEMDRLIGKLGLTDDVL